MSSTLTDEIIDAWTKRSMVVIREELLKEWSEKQPHELSTSGVVTWIPSRCVDNLYETFMTEFEEAQRIEIISHILKCDPTDDSLSPIPLNDLFEEKPPGRICTGLVILFMAMHFDTWMNPLVENTWQHICEKGIVAGGEFVVRLLQQFYPDDEAFVKELFRRISREQFKNIQTADELCYEISFGNRKHIRLSILAVMNECQQKHSKDKLTAYAKRQGFMGAAYGWGCIQDLFARLC